MITIVRFQFFLTSLFPLFQSGVMAKSLACDFEVSEFKLPSSNRVYFFLIIPLGKVLNLPVLKRWIKLPLRQG